MPGVLDIKIENGKLWKRMSPCCEWFEVGDFSTLETGAPNDDVVTPTEDEKEDLACKKASQMVDVLYNVAEVVAEAVPIHMTLTWLAARWYIQGHVEDAVSDLHWNWIYLATSYASATWALEFFTGGDIISEILPQNDRQTLKCKWVLLLSDDTAEITDNEWDQMISTLRTTVNLEAVPFLEPILRGIGKANMEWAATSAKTLTEFDCACPDVITDPRDLWPDSDWAYFADLRNGVPSWATLGGDSEYVSGKGIVDYPNISGYMNPEIRAALTMGADTTVIYGYLRYKVIWPGTDYQGNYTYCKSLSFAEHVWNGDYSPDTDPSAGGTITHTRVVVLDPTNGLHDWAWALEMNTLNGEDNDRLVYIEAIGLAGNGIDPFA